MVDADVLCPKQRLLPARTSPRLPMEKAWRASLAQAAITIGSLRVGVATVRDKQRLLLACHRKDMPEMLAARPVPSAAAWVGVVVLPGCPATRPGVVGKTVVVFSEVQC